MIKQWIKKWNLHSDMLALKQDQKGIMQRYLNEKNAWDYHLNQCKTIIRQQFHGGDKIAILGSGWLLDVPMQDLLASYKEIHLYDINHPRQILHKYYNNSKVKFITCDLTNGLYKTIGNHSKEELLQKLHANTWSLKFEKYSAVVSLNVLNQLDILFIDRLKKKYSFSANELKTIRLKIQKDHLASLKANHSLLISDVEEYATHLNEKIETKSQLAYCPLPTDSLLNQWLWQFENHGLYHKNHSTAFLVQAYAV